MFVPLHVDLHVRDDVVAELRTFDFRRAFHLAGEVVSHALAANGTVLAFQNQIRGFRPTQVAEHPFAAQHDRARSVTSVRHFVR